MAPEAEVEFASRGVLPLKPSACLPRQAKAFTASHAAPHLLGGLGGHSQAWGKLRPWQWGLKFNLGSSL